MRLLIIIMVGAFLAGIVVGETMSAEAGYDRQLEVH